MAMSDLSVSDLAAVTRDGDGIGNGGGVLWILLLFALFGGWGGNRGFGNQGGAGGVGGDALYPWMTLQQGFQDVQQSLCNGFGGVTAAITGGFAGAEASAAARQMATIQQMFGIQTAMMQGFSGQQMQLAGLGAQIAAEGCATRQAINENSRDIMANDTANYQRLMDKLCQLELDGVKGQLAQAQRENVGLQNQLNMAAFQASQVAQNAFIQQGFANEVDQLYNRLNSCPVPTTPVYGRTPIFTCQNNGCGCGMAA